MKKINYSILFLLVLLISSCKNEPESNDYIYLNNLIVVSKRSYKSEGYMINEIAFNNSESMVVGYGVYSNCNINDTICLKAEDDGFYEWILINCK